MAVVILEPKSATLVAGTGRAPPWRRDSISVLTMGVRLPHHAGIWLGADDRSFNGDVTLTIKAASTEHLEAFARFTDETGGSSQAGAVSDVVGAMRYSSGRDDGDDKVARKGAIAFETVVPAKFMGSIVGLARKGRFPRKVWVDVKGLGYRAGARHREGRLSWPQASEQPELPITDVSFEFPLHPQGEFALLHASGDEADPDAAQKAAARALQRFEPILIRLSAPMIWIVWFLLAVVVGFAFLNWRTA